MSEIKPALTPGEWRSLGVTGDDGPIFILKAAPPVSRVDTIHLEQDDGPAVQVHSPEARHALAALALLDQPFGFTWDDVDLLRLLAGYWDERVQVYVDGMRPQHAAECGNRRDLLRSIADRIAALLPPRET